MLEESTNMRWTSHQGTRTLCMLIWYYLYYQETDTDLIFATVSPHITLYCHVFIFLKILHKLIDIHARRKSAITFAQGCTPENIRKQPAQLMDKFRCWLQKGNHGYILYSWEHTRSFSTHGILLIIISMNKPLVCYLNWFRPYNIWFTSNKILIAMYNINPTDQLF